MITTTLTLDEPARSTAVVALHLELLNQLMDLETLAEEFMAGDGPTHRDGRPLRLVDAINTAGRVQQTLTAMAALGVPDWDCLLEDPAS